MPNRYLALLIITLTSLTIHPSPSTLDAVCAAIYHKHYAQLKYTDIPHQPACICFSAVPGMGKTYVAMLLEEKYHAVRISNDEIRTIIRSIADIQQPEALLHLYLAYFIEHYAAPNRFLILDASIDRKYTLLFPYFEQQHIPFLVIRLEVEFTQVVERLRQREINNEGIFIRHLAQWYTDYEKFGQTYSQVYRLKCDSTKPLLLDPLFDYIEAKIPVA